MSEFAGRQLALIAAHLDRQARGGHGGPALNSLELAGLADFMRSLDRMIRLLDVPDEIQRLIEHAWVQSELEGWDDDE